MKKGLSITGILIAVLFIASSFSIRENPQDPPRGGKKHIKLIKEDNGKKVELDTMVEGDKVFVWEGDTIGGKGLKWISEKEFDLVSDSLLKSGEREYNIEVTEDDGENKFIIVKSKNSDSKIQEFKIDGKSGNQFIYEIDSDNKTGSIVSGSAVWDENKGNQIIVRTPHSSKIVSVPDLNFSKRSMHGNVIDLSDPGIISFRKKKLSGGREKIEIIRNEVNDEQSDYDVSIDKKDDCCVIYRVHPKNPKRVKILKEKGGVFSVFESDEDVLKGGDEEDGSVVIKEIKNGDGKIFHIEEIKEGNGKKVKVTIQEDVEKDIKEEK